VQNSARRFRSQVDRVLQLDEQAEFRALVLAPGAQLVGDPVGELLPAISSFLLLPYLPQSLRLRSLVALGELSRRLLKLRRSFPVWAVRVHQLFDSLQWS
jgi:hypothetical protein